MVNIIVELSKYLIITIIIMYTYLCFRIFGYQDAEKKQRMLKRQNTLMFMLQLIAFMVLYLEMDDIKILGLYLAQMALFLATILLYTHIYPRVSRLVVNNMCMLLCIGLIMQTRLSYSKAMKQFVIAACAIALSLVIPIIIRKCKFLSEWRRIYAIIGLISLGVVVVIGQVSYGAMLGFTIAGINIQPSELVKIVFVFYVAASLKVSREFKDIVVTTAIAAFHVLILVVSKDLGAALIIFVVYLVMLYVATRQPLYILAGLGAGSVASRRVGVLEKFGAAITVIAPNTSEEIRKLADSRKIRLIEQTYEEVRDTIWQEKNFFMALAATGQTGTDARIKEDASNHSVWFNMASDKSQSEFYFPAIAQGRELTAGLISGGADPGLTHRVAKEVRRVLAEAEVENT